MHDDKPILTEEQFARLEAAAPKLVDLLIDLIEGRKYLAIETTPARDGIGQMHTFAILDDPAALPPAAAAHDTDLPDF